MHCTFISLSKPENRFADLHFADEEAEAHGQLLGLKRL